MFLRFSLFFTSAFIKNVTMLKKGSEMNPILIKKEFKQFSIILKGMLAFFLISLVGCMLLHDLISSDFNIRTWLPFYGIFNCIFAGILGSELFNMEIERRTLSFLFSRPLRKSTIVFSKFNAGLIFLAIPILLCFLCYIFFIPFEEMNSGIFLFPVLNLFCFHIAFFYALLRGGCTILHFNPVAKCLGVAINFLIVYQAICLFFYSRFTWLNIFHYFASSSDSYLFILGNFLAHIFLVHLFIYSYVYEQ
ncbi:ABC transporter permease subunit [Candidatus Riflebacteria bacterium]